MAFADKQKLQRLRQKLLRTLCVLDSSAEVVRSLKSQYQDGGGLAFTEQRDLVIAELNNHIAHCERHRRYVATLVQEANGIDELVSRRPDIWSLPCLANLPCQAAFKDPRIPK